MFALLSLTVGCRSTGEEYAWLDGYRQLETLARDYPARGFLTAIGSATMHDPADATRAAEDDALTRLTRGIEARIRSRSASDQREAWRDGGRGMRQGSGSVTARAFVDSDRVLVSTLTIARRWSPESAATADATTTCQVLIVVDLDAWRRRREVELRRAMAEWRLTIERAELNEPRPIDWLHAVAWARARARYREVVAQISRDIWLDSESVTVERERTIVPLAKRLAAGVGRSDKLLTAATAFIVAACESSGEVSASSRHEKRIAGIPFVVEIDRHDYEAWRDNNAVLCRCDASLTIDGRDSVAPWIGIGSGANRRAAKRAASESLISAWRSALAKGEW